MYCQLRHIRVASGITRCWWEERITSSSIERVERITQKKVNNRARVLREALKKCIKILVGENLTETFPYYDVISSIVLLVTSWESERD